MSIRRKYQGSGYGQHWVTDPNDDSPIKVKSSDNASLEPTTVHQVFKGVVDKHGDRLALSVERDGAMKHWTYKQYWQDANTAAKAMIKLGLGKRRCISIIGFNSPEWFIADVGSILAGGIAAGIYTTNGTEACRYIVDHSESQIVFVENKAQLDKFLPIRKELKTVKAFVIWDGVAPEGSRDIYSWADFMAIGDKEFDAEVNDRMMGTRPGHVSTLIYTSGTTGPPKAVMISHDNITWTAEVIRRVVEIDYNEEVLSYLPLSHIAAQLVDIHLPLGAGAHVTFARPDALKGSLVQSLQAVRPTMFLGVPRVWEKVQERMQALGAEVTGVKKMISTWAKKKGLEAFEMNQRGEKGTPAFFGLANSLVFSKIKERLGLDRCRFHATSAAPISRATLDYFASLNIILYEIYGMSESCGPHTVNRPGMHKVATAGPVFPGAEIKIDKPDANGNGEICFRGRHVFMGYLKNPEATAKTIDEDGWLHSGDEGNVDKDGFLRITGRIKELIVTAGGENVPPVLIEDQIKKELPCVSQVMVIGDARKFLSCVLTLKTDPNKSAADGEYPLSDKLSLLAVNDFAKSGITGITTVGEALKSPEVRKHLDAGLARVNKKATSNAQKVQKFTLLETDFTLEGGEMTPTMKLKRKIVNKKYETEIEAMYK